MASDGFSTPLAGETAPAEKLTTDERSGDGGREGQEDANIKEAVLLDPEQSNQLKLDIEGRRKEAEQSSENWKRVAQELREAAGKMRMQVRDAEPGGRGKDSVLKDDRRLYTCTVRVCWSRHSFFHGKT